MKQINDSIKSYKPLILEISVTSLNFCKEIDLDFYKNLT